MPESSGGQDDPRLEYYLAVALGDSRQLIGFARLGMSGVRAGKLGYAIAHEHQGKGYATDAARTLIRYGFESLGLHRITAAIGPDNIASVAVVNALGFRTKVGSEITCSPMVHGETRTFTQSWIPRSPRKIAVGTGCIRGPMA